MIAAFTELLNEHQPYLPDDEDLDGVVAAILRLQDTYQLTSQQIADGTFTPVNKSPPLSGILLLSNWSMQADFRVIYGTVQST